MGNGIGTVLPMAVGVAISPMPVIAVVLILGTPRARANGPAFACGWVAGLAIVGSIVLLLADGNTTEASGGPTTWASLLKLVFGVVFLLIAARLWRGRPRSGTEAPMPGWMHAVDGFAAGKSLGAGAALSGLNPKNLALTVAAATAITQAEVSGGQEAAVLTVFVAVGSLTILAPVAIYFAMGARAKEILDGLKDFMAVHNVAIMTVLLLVLGAKLIGDAVSGLSS